ILACILRLSYWRFGNSCSENSVFPCSIKTRHSLFHMCMQMINITITPANSLNTSLYKQKHKLGMVKPANTQTQDTLEASLLSVSIQKLNTYRSVAVRSPPTESRLHHLNVAVAT
ncbi:unnamed protein product, partial [Dicrocoelium dendriticum]